MSRLAEALTSDEHVVALKPRLEELGARCDAAAGGGAAPPTPRLHRRSRLRRRHRRAAPSGAGAGASSAPAADAARAGRQGAGDRGRKQQLHLSGAAAVAALDDLKARLASERDLELTLSWRLQRKGTQLVTVCRPPQIAAAARPRVARSSWTRRRDRRWSDPRDYRREPWPCASPARSLTQHGRQFQLRWCESSLAIREALCELEQQDAADGRAWWSSRRWRRTEVADDIAARLARARVFQPEGWDIVRQLFQAKETDARLGPLRVDAAGADRRRRAGCRTRRWPTASSTSSTAWREVLQRLLGIDTARPDAVALLQLVD